MDPGFSSPRVSLLDRGVVFAIAHIRGGGDLGRVWYDDGKLAKKMNTFTDFVAAAETVIARGYTDRSRLVIQGGSAGGLLMGAVVNLRQPAADGYQSGRRARGCVGTLRRVEGAGADLCVHVVAVGLVK